MIKITYYYVNNSIITLLLWQNYVMICLGFSNSCFDISVVTVQSGFTRDIRNNNFKNFLEGCVWTWQTLEEAEKK